MIKRGLLTIIFTLFITSFVNAQGLGLGPQVGFQKAQDADEGKFMFGAAVRMKLSPALGIEGSINYRQEEYAEGTATVKSWPVMVTGLFNPFPIVYGAIGAGWYNTTIDYDENLNTFVEDETTQEFGWHFGAGVELPVGVKTKLTGDIRYVFIDYDFEQIPGEGDMEANFYVIAVGLLFGR